MYAVSNELERWLPVVGFEGFYEVSNLGRVKSIARHVRTGNCIRTVTPKVLKPSLDRDGHPILSLSAGTSRQITKKVHSLVLHAFVGNRPKELQTRHLNGVKTDARLINLKYGTPEENYAGKVLHGGGVAGDLNPNSHVSRQKRKNNVCGK